MASVTWPNGCYGGTHNEKRVGGAQEEELSLHRAGNYKPLFFILGKKNSAFTITLTLHVLSYIGWSNISIYLFFLNPACVTTSSFHGIFVIRFSALVLP